MSSQSPTPHYPIAIVQALEECNRPLATLPVLELKYCRDYIDFVSLEDVPEGTPVMKFTDQVGRPGLAIRLRSRDNKVEGVLCFHARFIENINSWVRAGHHIDNSTLVKMYDNLHESEHLESSILMGCPLCPKFKTSKDTEFLIGLLRNQDPILRIWDDPVTVVETFDLQAKFDISRQHCMTLIQEIVSLRGQVRELETMVRDEASRKKLLRELITRRSSDTNDVMAALIAMGAMEDRE